MYISRQAMRINAGLLAVSVSAAQALVGYADSEIITFRSGNGTPGQPDSVIRLVAGSAGVPLSPDPWAGSNDAIFGSARNGPSAVLVNTNVIDQRWCGFSSLPADPQAQWIGVNGAADPHSTLFFAVPFTISLPNVTAASIDFHYAVDDRLGDDPGPNPFGLYLNGYPVIGSDGLPGLTCSQNDFSASLDPAWLVPNGQNWLYVYDRDAGRVVSGVMFTAAISVEAACADPPPGMVAWWPLDETEGTTAEDTVGDHHGTHIDNPTPVVGKVDVALEFDGVDQYVEVLHDPAFNFGTGDFSIDAWIRVNDDPVGSQAIISKYGESAPGRYVLGVTPIGEETFLLFAYGGQPAIVFLSSEPIPTGEWVHVGVTIETFEEDCDNSSRVTFFINGQPAGVNCSGRTFDVDNTYPVWIGSGYNIRNQYFQGRIDEVEMFNRALDPAEILAIYQAGSAGKCKCPCGDLDGDGDVDLEDFGRFQGCFTGPLP